VLEMTGLPGLSFCQRKGNQKGPMREKNEWHVMHPASAIQKNDHRTTPRHQVPCCVIA
jgi:hypothetical protein